MKASVLSFSFILVFCIFSSLVLGGLAKKSRDYYEILGVKRDATEREIKKAWKEFSLKYHPDKNPDQQEVFLEGKKAYEALKDEDKRRKYDQFGEEGLEERPEQQGGWNDVFGGFFGGFGGFNQRNNQMPKADSLVIPLEVTLADLYLGRTFTVLQKKQTLCHQCRGTGAEDPMDVKQCPGCKGSGVKIRTHQVGPGFIQQTQHTCDECGGKGRISKSTCPHCKGHKVEMGEDTLTVEVERGMSDGSTIVFHSKGNEEPDVTPGDIIFRVITKPLSGWVRKGNDLHLRVSLTLLEALVGFRKEISHLDNHTIVLERSDVTYPNLIQKIPEEGMPVHQYPSQKGDLYVEYYPIVFPESITQEQKRGFKDLLPQ